MQRTISRLMGTILMLALLIVGGLAVLAHARGADGVTGSGILAGPTPCPTPPVSEITEPSYVTWPQNLHELKAMSDLVAEVRIISFVRSGIMESGVSSIFTARVLTPIASKHATGIAAGATIQIRQTGGRLGCISYSWDGDQPMRPGERDILFLIRHQEYPFYDIVDGTAGRFLVDSNGQIESNAET